MKISKVSACESSGIANIDTSLNLADWALEFDLMWEITHGNAFLLLAALYREWRCVSITVEFNISPCGIPFDARYIHASSWHN